jgi:hypothetical protein
MSKKYIQATIPTKIFVLDEIRKNYKDFLNEQNEILRYYKTNTNQVGYVKFGEPLPLNSTEIKKDEYEALKYKPSNVKDYYWEKESLKGTKERMPPVEYHGEVYTTKDTKKPEKWGMYMGKLGDYDQQMEEHNSFMKKWFKDNAPGEDFYKNNMFYVMGEDGLPKFNSESLKNHIVGLHAEEANEYFAKKNNLLTEYNKNLVNIKKTHDAVIQRLNSEDAQIQKTYGQPDNEEFYRTGTGTKTYDYDPQGALGATLQSQSSGGVGTGVRSYDTWVSSGGQKIYFDKLIELSKKYQTETKNYSSNLSKEKKSYEKKLKLLNNEYIHPDFEWGIKKDEYKLYKELTEAQMAKWAEINKKKIEWSQKLWKEHNALEQMGMTGFDVATADGPTYGLSSEVLNLGNELQSLANQPISNWVKDETLKKQLELQKLKVKTEDLMLNQIYDEEVEMLQMSFGKKTDKQKEEERLSNRPWYVRAADITNYDVHDWMMLISLTCMILPGLQGVGLATRAMGLSEVTALGIGLTDAAIVAAAVDLIDAGIYVSEGNWELAGLSVLFAFIPFAIESEFVKRIGKQGLQKMAEFAKAVPDVFLKSTVNMTMEELYQYTKIILDDDVKRAIKAMAENSSELIDTMKGAYKRTSEKILGESGAKILNDGIQKSLKFSYDGVKYLAPKIGSLGKAGMVFGGYMAMGEVYHKTIDYTNENILKTPKSIAESFGLDWNLLKSEFHSDGSEKDNKLLKDALMMGWRPGIPVPLQFQTGLYKKWLSEQSKKVKEKISSSDFEKQLTDLLMNHVVTEKLVEEKTKEEKVKVEKWADENDGEIDKMGDEILEKYKKLEETNSQPVDSGDN